MANADIGLIGLAVMGQNLVLNMNDHGFVVAVYNRTTSKVDEFLAEARNASVAAHGTRVIGCHSIAALIQQLHKPRRVMLMVRAGSVVDDFIEQLLAHLEPGDIIIDGGNSLYRDTQRRTQRLQQQGILYIGTGISGGEEGARHGPSIMPGGNPAAWPHVQPIFQAIAAQVPGEPGTLASPCCDWVGADGAGHYVKMVHNGIEYGDMQIIAEAYDLLQRGLGLDYAALAATFRQWNQGVLNSYLIEITAHIFTKTDSDGTPLVAKILDAAGQKGTGKWTGIDALELGIPLTLIAEAVFARCLSAQHDERQRAAAVLPGVSNARVPGAVDAESRVQDVHDALYAAKIISYAQGFRLMREAAREYQWQLNYAAIAKLWRGGCIIRSVFLDNIVQAFMRQPELENLLLDEFFTQAITAALPGWRRAVIHGVELGIPLPAIGSALAYYDGYRSARLPANLLQAQRDYFGAHTFERTDHPRGEFFHADWTGTGGKTAASIYNL